MLREYTLMDAAAVDVALTQMVQRGANFLDNYMPMWFVSVNNYSLDMHSVTDCLLGQLFGHYQKGINALLIADPESYGFVADEITDNSSLSPETVYGMLASLWNDEINFRMGRG